MKSTIEAVTALSAMLEELDETDAIARAIRRYFGDPSEAAMAEVLRASKGVDGFDLRVHQALAPIQRGDLMRELVDADWQSVLEDEVLSMDALCGCGADCWNLIVRAQWLMQSMADVEEHFLDSIMKGVARQCSVFYFG